MWQVWHSRPSRPAGDSSHSSYGRSSGRPEVSTTSWQVAQSSDVPKAASPAELWASFGAGSERGPCIGPAGSSAWPEFQVRSMAEILWQASQVTPSSTMAGSVSNSKPSTQAPPRVPMALWHCVQNWACLPPWSATRVCDSVRKTGSIIA